MTIVITGASRGIGFATARYLAQQAHQVIALARSMDRLKDLAAPFPDNISYLPFDLETPDYGALDDVLGDKPVDALIHNAGWLINRKFTDLDQKDWEKSMFINIIAPALLTNALLPRLQKANQPHIVHITSMGGVQGSSKFPGLSAYSSSKGALSILTECLAEELKEKDIRVNALALGAVKTQMLEEAFPGFQAPLSAEKMGAYIGEFSLTGHHFFNGKILPVALSTP